MSKHYKSHLFRNKLFVDLFLILKIQNGSLIIRPHTFEKVNERFAFYESLIAPKYSHSFE